MKRFISTTAFSIVLALCLTSPAAMAAVKKGKANPEHKAAVKKCNDEYHTALNEAKTKKGKEHKDAVAAAKKSHHDCLAGAK